MIKECITGQDPIYIYIYIIYIYIYITIWYRVLASFQLTTMIIVEFEDVEVGKGAIFCFPKSRGNRGAVFHHLRNTSTQTAMAGIRKIQQVMTPKNIVMQT
jgi:hypothetical protein